jgi:hypothetical protein
MCNHEELKDNNGGKFALRGKFLQIGLASAAAITLLISILPAIVTRLSGR